MNNRTSSTTATLTVTDEMVERAYAAFRFGPPGVLRSVQLVDSYPGEYPGDPDAYHTLPCTVREELMALRDALTAALSKMSP